MKKQNKVIQAHEAIKLVKDNNFLVIGGSGWGINEPSCLLKNLGQNYQNEKSPKNLTIYHCTGLGDQKEIGTDYLAHEGLVKRDIGGHWGMAPKMVQLAIDEKIEAYNLPQGVMSQMCQAVAANKPGVISKVGLNTFIDPRLEGGKMNSSAKEDIIKVIYLNGEEWLFYPKFNFDVCFIRGTTADLDGNITMEEEAAILENAAIAQATKNCGGVTIVQVKYLANRGELKAKDIKIPGIYVDYVVLDPNQMQTVESFYNPVLCGNFKAPFKNLKPLPLDKRKIVARRAAKELFPGAVVNLGFGIGAGVAAIAVEEGIIDDITFTVEQGSIGGMPVGGKEFGASYNPIVIIDQISQFNFYDGGGLDITFLGVAEVDQYGNVNASKTGKLLAGCGGFINISQNAKKVVFCANFTAKGLDLLIKNNQLFIKKEGSIKKFKSEVSQITFSGAYAKKLKQDVLYVTERAVFKLSEKGLVLTEVAPGIDLQKDILDLMEFRPIIAKDLGVMDEKIFK